ncbi:hypothetical protein GT037_004613 [Alternaria burnsii]|uniref:Uncharacterized protein n=1 Tax=Alternaria burnsii TaxID=1187904 RepID=A0A8H7EJ84_9PLEO|nr:uncharacterized protein GT037_004613 [Alternaria burnsii]KAF7677754.1 hypothetical protein GT037_004613 [Alternaria burnsii]
MLPPVNITVSIDPQVQECRNLHMNWYKTIPKGSAFKSRIQPPQKAQVPVTDILRLRRQSGTSEALRHYPGLHHVKLDFSATAWLELSAAHSYNTT